MIDFFIMNDEVSPVPAQPKATVSSQPQLAHTAVQAEQDSFQDDVRNEGDELDQEFENF
jgi:hypothetical protein